MSKLLYPEFLERDEEYQASERYWRTLFDALAAERGQGGEWHPWRPRAYADGTPFERDGNPMFDARSARLGRAVQVIQWPPESDDVEISAWISALPLEDEDGETVTEELTLNLSLSEESAALARRLLERWMDEAVTADQMRDFIATVIPAPAT